MLTILEAAKLNPSPLVSGVVEVFARENPILLNLPFETINGTAYVYNREGVLPGIAFRGINESYTESTGVINPATEPLKICGGESDFDTFIVKTGTNDARAVHDMLKSKALSLNWMRTFFDGDSNKQPREFDGLNVRLTGGQVIDCNTTPNLLTLAKDEILDLYGECLKAVKGTRNLKPVLPIRGF